MELVYRTDEGSGTYAKLIKLTKELSLQERGTVPLRLGKRRDTRGGGSSSMTVGLERLRAINALITSPALGITLSPNQMIMIRKFVDANLPSIFGVTWDANKQRIMQARGIKRLKAEQVVLLLLARVDE